MARFDFIFVPWLIAIMIFFALLIVIVTLSPKSRFLKKHKSEYLAQSQAIKLERQRISEELHDELGSGLAAIKLYSDLLTKKHTEIVEIKEINEMINEISLKINDIIWTTSTENDHLDNLIFYINDQLAKLFKHSNIIFKSILPENIPTLKIKSESRRNFYLLAKEIAHNALKHSNATKISMEITVSEEIITLIIKDNGKGFDPLAKSNVGMGLTNIHARIKRLNGVLTIENYRGTKVLVTVPILDNFYTEVRKEKQSRISRIWNKLNLF